MTNRYPLIINSISQIIEELPVGDNLDLTSSNIVNAGSVQATSFSGDGSSLTNVTANTVSNATQANITSLGTLTSLNVTGNVALSGANVALGAVGNLEITGGTNGYVLQTDGTGNLSWVAQSAGGGSSISNGTSNVNIVTLNGNVTTSVGGTANVLVITATGANISGTLNVTGQSNLGLVGNVIITGGTNGYVLSTNGSGNLSWVAQSGGGGGSSGYEQIFLMMGA